MKANALFLALTLGFSGTVGAQGLNVTSGYFNPQVSCRAQDGIYKTVVIRNLKGTQVVQLNDIADENVDLHVVGSAIRFRTQGLKDDESVKIEDGGSVLRIDSSIAKNVTDASEYLSVSYLSKIDLQNLRNALAKVSIDLPENLSGREYQRIFVATCVTSLYLSTKEGERPVLANLENLSYSRDRLRASFRFQLDQKYYLNEAATAFERRGTIVSEKKDYEYQLAKMQERLMAAPKARHGYDMDKVRIGFNETGTAANVLNQILTLSEEQRNTLSESYYRSNFVLETFIF